MDRQRGFGDAEVDRWRVNVRVQWRVVILLGRFGARVEGLSGLYWELYRGSF